MMTSRGLVIIQKIGERIDSYSSLLAAIAKSLQQLALRSFHVPIRQINVPIPRVLYRKLDRK